LILPWGELLAHERWILTPEQIQAMAAHNEATGAICQNKMDWALYASEKLTGLIVAAALILPSKKLPDVTVESVLRRFKEKGFARGASRENILQFVKLNELVGSEATVQGEKQKLSLEDFVKICLPAMQEISGELGL